MSKPNEDRDVYYIPPNFLTSGRLFGGMIRARNAIEACVLVLLTGVPIIKLPFSLTTRIIILCLVSLPLGIFGVIGFEGDSLSEFAVNWVRWLIHRRTLYRSDTPVPEAPEKPMKAVSGMSAPKPPEQLGIKIKENPKKRKKRNPVKKPHKASKHKSSVAKKKQPLHAEDFIPVRDIRNGIIETTDGRYLRVIEVEPINFLLRNISEQKNIVASFASWMKISPVKVQIKVLTKKADIGKHLNTIEREMEAEDNPKCRDLQLDYYHLIQTIGSREAITRRFLVIFEYEAVTNRKPEYAEIVSALETAVQTARQYFLHCDNAVVAHEDENIFLTETVYLSGKDQDVITVTFGNDKMGSLLIVKKDAVTGAPISDVEFLVTDSDGSVIGTANGKYGTDSAGTIRIDGLTPGMTVIVKEVRAKDGYILDDTPQSIKIKRNSVMTLEFRNQPKGGVLVRKVDAATNEPISDVEFLVTDPDGNFIGNANGKYVTDSAGTFTITDVAPDTTLVIKETRAKDGYILDDTPQTVKVKSNEVITVEFRNQPKGGVLVKKVDAATNEPISDVEFLVTDSDGNFIGNANGKFITDSTGTFTITDIAPGTTLIIKETRAKDGYLLDDTPQTVKVKSNEMITLEFRNQPLGGLRIIKLDSVTKKPLEGVQFRITYSDGSFVADEGGKLSSNGLYMTDANGEILIRDIVGTLVVTEVKTIPGYTIDEATRSQTIVVNPDDLQTLIVYNVPAGGLQIIKSDEDTGERLGGVKFEIRKINGEILGTYTTDRDGVISIPNAESGWYSIVERKAKDGYALDTTPVNACVKDSETTTVEITNQRMASIMIHKIDAATGAGIYGVKFVLYDSGKNPIGEYTTDQDGYIFIDDELVPGKYYLRELEAADGYIRDEQYKTVYVERGKCAQIEWENSAVTGQIQIRKYSSEDNTVTGQLAGTPLEGAVFEVTQARSGKVVGYIVTDARGVAASGPLPLGRYFVTEVSAPKYYQLSGEKMEAEIEYPSQIIKLSAYNKPAALGVTIKKSGNYEVQSGQAMSYDFSGIANTSNVALNHFFWHDRIPTDATLALSISTGTYNARLYYKVTFKTNLNDYRTLASNLLTANNYSLSLNAATLRLAQGEYVTDVRFEFGTVPSGFSSVVKPTMRVQVLGTVSNGYQIINRADVGGQYLNEWQTAKATWVTTVCRFNNNPLPKTGY